MEDTAKPQPNIDDQALASIRAAYETEVKALASLAKELRDQGKSSEEIARHLHGKRREIGVKYKEITPPEHLKKIHERNLKKYGDELGPTIEWLRLRGKSWEDIIDKASQPGGKDIVPENIRPK